MFKTRYFNKKIIYVNQYFNNNNNNNNNNNSIFFCATPNAALDITKLALIFFLIKEFML